MRQRIARGMRMSLPYLVIPGLNALSPLVVLPAISHAFGLAGWTAVAIAQSLGATAAVAIGLGWGLSGTQRVARQVDRSIARTFTTATLTRTVPAAVLLPATAVATAMLVGEHVFAAVLIAVGTALTGFSAGWVFIGTGRPARILWSEALPRFALTGAAALLILAGQSLAWYGWALVAASLVAATVPARLLGVHATDLVRLSPSRVLRLTGRQWPALTSGLLSTAYMSFAATAVAIVAPGALALFAAVDRVMRMVLQVLFGLNRMLQKWVGGAARADERIRRAGVVVLVTAGAGVVCGVGFALVSPWLIGLVFAGTIEVPREAALVAGGTLAVVLVSNATGNTLLVALGRIVGVTLSAAVGCVVGLPLIFWGAHLGGALGGLLGQLAAEAAVVITQIAVAVIVLRRRTRTVVA